MPGNRTGGLRAAATNKLRYGADFYKVIGAKGGRISKGGGFTVPGVASYWGKINGKKYNRLGVKNKER